MQSARFLDEHQNWQQNERGEYSNRSTESAKGAEEDTGSGMQ